MRRTAFAATGAEVDTALGMERGAWLRAALAVDPADDPGTLATPPPALEPVGPLPTHPSRLQRRTRNEELRRQRDALAGWWVRRMVATGAPVVERVTFGWHDHFATDLRVVRNASMMLAQNETQRRLGRAGFTEVVGSMVGDAALLTYLNGSATAAGTRNENLARELLEVFTLGRGAGWSEQDVREASRALTGWEIDTGGTARFIPAWHDGGRKTVLGRTGALDASTLVEAVLSHRAAAPHLVGRWWSQLVSSSGDAPPAGVAQRAIAAYGPRRDLGALLATLVTDPEVEAMAPSLVRAPVDWFVGAARTLGLRLDDEQGRTAVHLLRSLGQEPFCPPNVGGWPVGRAWLSTGALQTRITAAGWLVGQADLGPLAETSPSGRVDAVTRLLGLPTLSPRTAVGLRTVSSDPAALLTAALVSPENLVV